MTNTPPDKNDANAVGLPEFNSGSTLRRQPKPLLTLPGKNKSKKKSSPPNNKGATPRNVPVNSTPSNSALASDASIPSTITPAEHRPKMRGLGMGATMTLHTNLAMSTWHGRSQDIERDIRPIIGVTRFAASIGNIWNESARNNPVADWILLIAEERYEIADSEVSKNLKAIRKILEDQEVFDDIESATNIQPVTLELHFHSPWAYRAAALVKKLDDVVRLCLTARHLGLFSDEDWKTLVLESSRRVRGFLGVAALDLRVHLHRDWFNGRGNRKLAEARQEIRRLGKKLPFLPKDVMAGTRRAGLAPAVLSQFKSDAEERSRREPSDTSSEVPSSNADANASATTAAQRHFVNPVRSSKPDFSFDFYKLKSSVPAVDLDTDEIPATQKVIEPIEQLTGAESHSTDRGDNSQ